MSRTTSLARFLCTLGCLAARALASPHPVEELDALITPPALLPEHYFGLRSFTSPKEEPGILERAKNLFKRAAETCAYLSANTNYPLMCSAPYECGWNTHIWVAQCCQDPTYCYYVTACVDYAHASSCVGSCLGDPHVLKCTSDAVNYGYCLTAEILVSGFESPFWHYECASYATGIYTAYADFNTPKTPVNVVATTTPVQQEATTSSNVLSPTPSPSSGGSGSGNGDGNGGGSGNGNGDGGGSANGNGNGPGSGNGCNGNTGTCIINGNGKSGLAATAMLPDKALLLGLGAFWGLSVVLGL